MISLPTLWFIVLAFLWTGYLFLEGFDLGVGMLMKLMGRSEKDRRVMLNTIGPVWDGNEVWLITAGAMTFATFPLWYAALFSALYIPLVFVLLGLIFRAVSIEYRGKHNDDRWRSRWDWGMALGSFVSAFGVGAALALTTTGLPLNANGDRLGGAFAWFNGYAVLGGLAVVAFCLVHACVFLALKTRGDIEVRARRAVVRWLPLGVLPMAVWAIVVQMQNGKALTLIPLVIAVVAVVLSWTMARRTRDGWSFIYMGLFLVAGVFTIFASLYPNVLPSTLDPAWNLTVDNASSSDYTLTVISWVSLFGLPLVVLYQGWTYWVFRKRITAEAIPAAHTVNAQ
ncbi:cytochrome d ubiquinol oxidase subunit II [Arthrobacter sp. zg-Y1219]|uniref:cytochrome d ubiquinol oxidase subunit II n=1 Tax=Arthrobacter sp. zg-Y1219 TaxID=3049067 RepID=UPI0024C41E31|nr:cytochrome d ubiquinol oxidase subunit II [Arthrobacter sp. zg-Y1219]MDK1360980.1 cytochrome d ubiquinol oxidase subunit II [Arthrobacter sp. zg-Y1219]